MSHSTNILIKLALDIFGAKVHIDLTIEQAQALIVQLQTGIAEAEHLNEVCKVGDDAIDIQP